MKKTLTKMALGAVVLTGVAVVSYNAGAAKAKEALQMPAGDIKWEAMGGAMNMAKLWGDRDKGPEYGMLLKFPGGTDSGMHAHTGDYHAISIQGTWVHSVEGETTPAKELPPGSTVFQPGKQMHDASTQGEAGLHHLRPPAREGRLHPVEEAGRSARRPSGCSTRLPAEK